MVDGLCPLIIVAATTLQFNTAVVQKSYCKVKWDRYVFFTALNQSVQYKERKLMCTIAISVRL